MYNSRQPYPKWYDEEEEGMSLDELKKLFNFLLEKILSMNLTILDSTSHDFPDNIRIPKKHKL